MCNIWSRDSSVYIAARVRAGRPGFQSLQGQEIFFSPIASRQALSDGYPGYEAAVREDDHLSLSIAEVKSGGAIPPLPYTPSWHSP
jgi:hypothetical protein